MTKNTVEASFSAFAITAFQSGEVLAVVYASKCRPSIIYYVRCAVRLCVCANNDRRLVVLVSCECVLIRSSTLWLQPFTLL